jgi:hypothetical protein
MKTSVRNLLPPTHVVRGTSHDDIEMTLLSDSIESNGLLVPLTVHSSGKIIDGYRRWLCCKAMGWDEIEVHEVDGDPDALRVIAQSRSTPLDRTAKRTLVGEYLQRNREATAATIAHAFNWSPEEVESLAGTQYLIQSIKAAYDAGEITLAEVWQLSRCTNDSQLDLWDAGRDDLYNRAAATLRETRSARRRNMVSRPRGKTYGQIARERERLTEAGVALIRAKAETPLDGWKACLEWILSTK